MSVSVDQEQLFPEDKDFGVNLYLSKMTCRKVSCPQPISKFSGILLLLLILLTEVSINHMDLGHADRVSFYARDVGIIAKDAYRGIKYIMEIDMLIVRKQCQFAFVYINIKR